MSGLGRTLIAAGLLLAALGVLLVLGESFGHRLPFRMGRLPGDIVYKSRNTVVYFPLVTCLLLSVLLSALLWLFGRK